MEAQRGDLVHPPAGVPHHELVQQPEAQRRGERHCPHREEEHPPPEAEGEDGGQLTAATEQRHEGGARQQQGRRRELVGRHHRLPPVELHHVPHPVGSGVRAGAVDEVRHQNTTSSPASTAPTSTR
jgi:hypothetical protein